MGTVTSSLHSSTWHVPPPAAQAPTPPIVSSTLETALLIYTGRTVLVRLHNSYSEAISTARTAFRIPQNADVSLEVEWDGAHGEEKVKVELSEAVWGVVNPGAKLFVKVTSDMTTAEEREGASKRSLQPEQGGEGGNGEVKKVRRQEGEAQTTDGSVEEAEPIRVDKGKGRAIDQGGGQHEGERVRVEEEATAFDPDKAVRLFEQLGYTPFDRPDKATTATSSSSTGFVCEHGHPLPPFPSFGGATDDFDDFGLLTVKEHSGGVITRVPYDQHSDQTIQSVFNAIDRKTDDTNYSLVHDGLYLERERGWKRLGYYSIEPGDELKILRKDQVIVDAFLRPRHQHLYLEAVRSTTNEDVLSIIAFTLEIPLCDLYISSACYPHDSEHPPFPDERRCDPKEALLDDETAEEYMFSGQGPVVCLHVWVMSEAWAKKEVEERAKVGGDPGGSGLRKEEKKGEQQQEVEKAEVDATAAAPAREAVVEGAGEDLEGSQIE